MGQATTIGWADSTVNPSSGCDGCELWDGKMNRHCYAGNIHEDRLAKSLPLLYAPHFTDVRMIPGRMAAAARWSDLTGKDRPGKPWLNGMPRHIFISDMADLLSRDITFEFISREVISTVADSPHIWMWLTKQPARMALFSGWMKANGQPWPPNLYAMTSITSEATMGRVGHLLKVGDSSSVRMLSVEPLLGHVDIGDTEDSVLATIGVIPGPHGEGVEYPIRPRIDGVIVGGESGPNARPCDLKWIRQVKSDCMDSGVPVFVKQIGSFPIWDGCGLVANNPKCRTEQCTLGDRVVFRLFPSDRKGENINEFPADLQVRQLPTARIRQGAFALKG